LFSITGPEGEFSDYSRNHEFENMGITTHPRAAKWIDLTYNPLK
jgi:hypothetical protein